MLGHDTAAATRKAPVDALGRKGGEMRFAMAVFACISAWTISFTTPSYAGDGGKVAILMPGGDGLGSPNEFLMRNRNRFTQAGIRTDVARSSEDAVSLSKSEQARAERVILVGMSLGVVRAAQALAAGAQVTQAWHPGAASTDADSA